MILMTSEAVATAASYSDSKAWSKGRATSSGIALGGLSLPLILIGRKLGRVGIFGHSG